ncbi:MAG: flavodoxin domain-containing protein [Syntrophobacteraceae bacterium]|nr:flavodoxin domain-containing protein [Syntrophobacteraceae bacterium]
MQPVEIKKDIYWVGAIDWNIRDFHGYSTPKGTTYNAFLVKDDKITLFDVVKKPFKDDLVQNVKRLGVEKLDYLVVNHVEMDHSGALPEVIEVLRPERIVCSPAGKKALMDHYHREDWPFEVVETGQELSLGKRTLQFLETRMLHWPDSMMSYIEEDRLLISSDGFGQHWATSERFDDEVNQEELLAHAAKYYANILLLFSPLVQKLIAKVQELGLQIDMIAPDHGLIWRSDPGRIIQAYNSWSLQESREKALIIYDTMWQSTEKMAFAIAEGLNQEGAAFKLLNLKLNHRSDIMTEVLDAKAIVFGSSTINNGMMPSMADVLCYMKGLRPIGKLGVAFGSYGWSGEAVKHITDVLTEMKFKVLNGGLRVRFAPTPEDLEKCVDLGRQIGKEVKRAKV